MSTKNNSSKSLRTKNWRLVSYLPLNVALERLCILEQKQYVRYYAIAEHDKDLDELGNPKGKHVHILVNLYNSRSQSEICKHFIDRDNDAGNCFGIVMDDKRDAYEYLWHKNDLDKYQYDADIVISNCDEFFWSNTIDYDEQSYCIFMDMIAGIDLPTMIKRYGRDFAIHYGSYRMMLQDHREKRLGLKE